ncbi:MAG: ATP-binding cassette domain-containing protein [Bacteroidales bacterium]|nr:ATP-binding cassette domain-containing protein [Bacteroidales bacterium]
MNETILKALMRLFAIIANADAEKVSDKARTVVKSYLDMMLNQEFSDIYLKLFDEYVQLHHHVRKDDNRKVRKQTSLNSVKVLKICSEINEQLQQKEKIIVVIRLIEFINQDSLITEKELDFVKTVSDIFNISEIEFSQTFKLATNKINDFTNKADVIIINSEQKKTNKLFKHKYVKNLDGVLYILRIESTNSYVLKYLGHDSLFLNSQNINPDRLYIFDNGAVIKSQRINNIYYSDIVSRFLNEDVSSKVVLKAENIEFYYHNSNNGIHKFSFTETSGRMLGIMGGSGVGKSTLLNVLNGTFPLHGGKITINGYDLHKEKENLKGVIGFVPQDDLLIEELTVYQNLYYNAKLCFSNFTNKQIKQAVDKVLTDLDLTDVKNLTVGGPTNKFISGGQRKRLNIALELMREPAILIVDEPTSGLSSMDSDMVMNLLKEQALKNKLVLVNIHQPSSDIYKLFDSLLMMDKGGHPVYYGNPVDALGYFKKAANYVNPEESGCSCCGNVDAQQPLEILESKVVDEYGKVTKVRKINPEEWYIKFKNEIEPEAQNDEIEIIDKKLPENHFKIPSGFKQFLIFTIRNIKSKLTNKQYLLITFFEAPILAVILGYFTKYISGTDTNPNAYIFAENVNIIAYLFMAVTVALFFGMTLSAEEIIKDKKILNREKFLNLSRISYLNSKIIVLFIISAIQTLTFIIIGNLILEIHGMTLIYWAILFTTAAFANILGLNISAVFDSVVTIYITIPFILVPQLLFSGAIVDFTKLHKDLTSYKEVPVVGDLMTSRWAYEALAVAQFKDNNYEKYYFKVDMLKSQNNYKLSYLIPELKNYANTCINNLKKKKDTNITIHKLTVLKNELINLNNNSPVQFNEIDKINIKNFNSEVYTALENYFDRFSKFLNKNQYKLNLKTDSVSRFLINKLGGRDAVFELKQKNHNKKLEEILRNKAEFAAVKEENNELVQVIDPIFKLPESNIGRAHFYAPVKRIGPYTFDTVWFNIIFIWFTTLIIYLTLISDVFRKIFNIFNKE